MLKLQRVQNCFARVVTRVGCFAPSTPLHHSVHRFPISFRIKFKVLALTCKTPSSGNLPILLILSIWPHPAGAYGSIKAFSYLLLSARLRPEPEFSAFVHLLSGTNFPCVFALLNPWLVFGNIWKLLFLAWCILHIVSWLPNFLVTNMAFLWTYILSLELLALKCLWTWLCQQYWCYRSY